MENQKVNQLLKDYKRQLERKLNLLQPYINKKNTIDDSIVWDIIDQENYSRLKAETEMLKKHIDDLQWILE